MMAEGDTHRDATTHRDGPERECPVCDVLHPVGHEACPGRRVGEVVAGKYYLDYVIGAGGIGAVYSAVHRALHRRVALKMLQPQYAKDDDLGRRFVREARQQALIGHPGIVAVHDAGHDREFGCYLEMEELDGGTIYDLLEEHGAMTAQRTAHLALDMLSTLAAIHDQGIVHRDLKPMNLFVINDDRGERVKIIDFGLIKVDDGHALTHTGDVLGTILYMSPEQFVDPRSVDARTDLFALGITLFEMLTGKSPVEYEDRAELRKKILHGDLSRHPKAIDDTIPAWLDAVVAKAMAPDREDRFASAADMAAAIEAGLAADATPPSWWQRLLGRA